MLTLSRLAARVPPFLDKGRTRAASVTRAAVLVKKALPLSWTVPQSPKVSRAGKFIILTTYTLIRLHVCACLKPLGACTCFRVRVCTGVSDHNSIYAGARLCVYLDAWTFAFVYPLQGWGLLPGVVNRENRRTVLAYVRPGRVYVYTCL